MAWLVTRDERALAEEIRTRGSMHRAGLGDDPSGIDTETALTEFLAYAGKFAADDIDMSRKVAHSLRVAILCDDLAAGAEGDEDGDGGDGWWVRWRGAGLDRRVATVAGLLHDVGRFPQWAMHRSYSDLKTHCDHGWLGADLLSGYGMLRRIVGDGRDGDPMPAAIVTAVRFHNALAVPGDADEVGRALCEAVREADVIDILDLCAEGDLHRGIDGPASADVMAQALSGQLVDRRIVRTKTDSVMQAMAIAQVVRSPRGRSIALAHAAPLRYLASVEEGGMACDEGLAQLRAVVAVAMAHLGGGA